MLCSFCAGVSLEYDLDALAVVCRQCGYVSDAAELEVIGRATEDYGHLAGRQQLGVQGVGPLLLSLRATQDSVKAKEQRTHSHLNNHHGIIATACNVLGVPALTDRAFHFFKQAHSEFAFQFGCVASPWVAGSIWLAADDANDTINTNRLAELCETTHLQAAKRKFDMRKYSSLNWNSCRHVRLPAEIVHVIISFLAFLAKTQSTSEEAAIFIIKGQLNDKNMLYLQQATKASNVAKISQLAITLASRFSNNMRVTTEAPFACACVLVGVEAVMRKVVPLMSNLVDLLAEVCLDQSAYTINERYREMIRWAKETYCTLPWINEKDKASMRKEIGENRRALEEIPQSKKTKSAAKTAAKPCKRELACFLEQIITFVPIGQSAPLATIAAGESDRNALLDPTLARAGVPLPESMQINESRLSDYTKSSRSTSSRIRVVDSAANLLAGDASTVNAHDENVRHYHRLMLSGVDANTLKVSQETAHAPVAPEIRSDGTLAKFSKAAAHRALIAQTLLNKGHLDDVDDDALFMEGELAGYFRTPEERAAHIAELEADGRIAEMDQAAIRHVARAKAATEQQDRAVKRQATQKAKELAPAAKSSQKRKRDDEEDEWRNSLFGIERDILDLDECMDLDIGSEEETFSPLLSLQTLEKEYGNWERTRRDCE